jgi:hypothetical protein
MTLTEAAFWSKRLGVIAIGLFAFIFLIVVIVYNPGNVELPPQYLTPNCACTQKADDFLKHALTIPSYEISPNSTPQYSIQTETGVLDDNLPDIVNVYRYTDLGEKINAQSLAKVLAAKMGFKAEEIRTLGTKEYIWQDFETQRAVRITVEDLNFTLTTNISKIRSARAAADLPSEEEAKRLAKSALSELGIYSSEFNDASPLTYLININDDGSYTEADSLLNAELIRVDFHKAFSLISIPSNIVGADRMIASLEKRNMAATVDKMTINDKTVEVYNFKTLLTHQNPNKSNVSVYVGPESKDFKKLKNIYQIDYKSWKIEPESCGTYPLISAAVAEEKIKNGEGSLVSLDKNGDEVAQYTPQEVKKFLITNIAITYYEGSIVQHFLQPVYYFSGEAELADGTRAEFVIYYPAINYDIVTDKIELKPAPVQDSTGFGLF